MGKVKLFWTLNQGESVLAHLYIDDGLDMPGYSQDFPFTGYRFEATEEFLTLKNLFDDALAVVEVVDIEQEISTWNQINSLGLTLKSVDKEETLLIRAPIEADEMTLEPEKMKHAYIHIDTAEEVAWFRLW